MKQLFNMAVVVLLVAGLVSCAKKEQPSTLDVQRSSTTSAVATVEKIKLKERMVTLRSLEGRLFNVHVGEEAVNLPQLRVGDQVEITYAESLEVRMAEPGESMSTVESVIGTAEPGSKPAGIGMTEITVTATILELDKVNEIATLKMEDGSVASVKVQNPENLYKVKVGDRIAIKYLEALEIKVKGKK
jgi:hypothetical protein